METHPIGYYLEVDVNRESKRVGVEHLDLGTWPLNLRFDCIAVIGQAKKVVDGDRYLTNICQKVTHALKPNRRDIHETTVCSGLLLVKLAASEEFVRAGWFGGFQLFLELCQMRKLWVHVS